MAPEVIVITGASAGIGAAAAECLAGRGHHVVLAARRADALRAVADRCGPGARVVAADVTRRDEVRKVRDAALAAFGRIDVWINNVGQGISRLPTQLTDQDLDDMMRVNVKSALYGMQEVLPHFQARGDGHVINVSSMLGRVPFAVIRSAYTGAKHFLNALTATFRMEVQEQYPGIQFSLLSPGVVGTEFGRNALHGGPDSRGLPDPQDPKDVAEVIAGLVESRAPDLYTRKGSAQRVAAYYASVGADP